MRNIFQNSVGVLISLVLKDNGTPIDLTDATTVAIQMLGQGTNTLKWSHNATVDTAASGLAHYTSVAGDFDTMGDFYTNVVITYTDGTITTVMDDFYRVISNQQSVVTPKDLLQFMNIPEENAIPTATIQRYIDQEQANLDLLQPSLITTTDPKKIQLRQNLITIKAAVLYFMNMGENNVNPEVRIEKIKLWNKEYNAWMDRLNSALSSAANNSGAVRRVINGKQVIIGSSSGPSLATSTNSVSSMNAYTLRKLGSNCDGSNGTTGRNLSLVNSNMVQSATYFIFRNGALIDQGDYSLSSAAAGTTVTFTNINIFDGDSLTLSWWV